MKAITLAIPLFISHAAAQPSFVTIGDLPGGYHNSHAIGVSSDGSVVTGFSYATGGMLAFRWTQESGMEALPVLPGTGGYQGGPVSPNGKFITGTHVIQGQKGQNGFVWSEETGTVSIGSLPGGRNMSILGHITDDGLGVGRSDFDLTPTGYPLYRAVKWTAQSGLEALPLPEPTDLQYQSSAGRVLNDGRIFGVSNSGKWFYSEESGFEMLPVSRYMNTINSSGDFIIGTMLDSTSPIPHRARYWTPDTGEVPLAPYGDDYASEALFLSDDGSVIIGRGTQGWQVWLDQGAPVLVEELVANLGVDLDGWYIDFIYGISGDGSKIYGTAINNTGKNLMIEGFVLTIPAPASASVLALGVLAFTRKR